MPRVFVTDESLRPIVQGLAKLFFSEGSMLAVSRKLSEVLAASGDDSRLYPNRLVSVLSEDPTKSVNDQTALTLRSALERIDFKANESEAARAAKARVVACWSRLPHSGFSDAVFRVAEQLGFPPAVVRVALEEAGKLTPATTALARTASKRSRAGPDWSFQDDAYQAVVSALQRDPNGKVGLVLPTGGGKTRTAIRVALRILADHPSHNSVVLWVTHRRFLRTQGMRELQRAMKSGTPDIPENAVKLLSSRVEVILVSQLAQKLSEHQGRVALLVVDEAHRAAAPSYAPIFAAPVLRGLFLTATPNRTDQRAIGIDGIAYTITYRELFRRGVLVEPQFDPALVLPRRMWEEEEGLSDLCDYILQRTRTEFTKVIVVASRIDHVTKIYDAMLAELKRNDDLDITADEIGFVHGSASSSGVNPEVFLDEFVAFERGVLVTTAQMLGEGFDDPKINAVVMTYPTSSMLQLMQVAGRGLRYAPEKTRAYIVQAKESSLAYHFEQRWLYQDISDVLRPKLLDYSYGSMAQLQEQLKDLFRRLNIGGDRAQHVMDTLSVARPEEEFSLLFSGMPYAGDAEHFEDEAAWHMVPVTERNRSEFLSIFNDFSQIAGDVKATDFLQAYVPFNTDQGSSWLTYRDMLTAMEYARREISSETYADAKSRPYTESIGTTWLLYATFRYQPVVPATLEEFLADAVNRNQLLAQYAMEPPRWRGCVKVEFPLGGSQGVLLSSEQYAWLDTERTLLLERLRKQEWQDVFGQVSAWRATCSASPIPMWILDRFDTLITDEGYALHTIMVSS